MSYSVDVIGVQCVPVDSDATHPTGVGAWTDGVVEHHSVLAYGASRCGHWVVVLHREDDVSITVEVATHSWPVAIPESFSTLRETVFHLLRFRFPEMDFGKFSSVIFAEGDASFGF